MKTILTGNEAVATGAFEAGVTAASGYPGTPATEIIETISRYPEVYTEWSVNEKTALEFASGVSLSGRRALVVMKHVGLNVASDPLISLAYTGINGGLVIAVSDDPGMWSSQNEQDSRMYGRIANIPVFEPSDSEEAYSYTKKAFEVSEAFDLPVILRLTRAISHTSTIVNTEGIREEHNKKYSINTVKNVLLPPFTSTQRISLLRRIKDLRDFIPSLGFNRIEFAGNKLGIITSGITYQYVKEAVPDASVLKLGIVYPLNTREIHGFRDSCKEIYVIEESAPFIEEMLRAMGIKLKGKEDGLLPETGELNKWILKNAFKGKLSTSGELCTNNHSFLCPGCPYLGIFYVLSKKSFFIGGDIGCYTLSVHTFPNVLDTTLCMGSGISQATGYSISTGEKALAVVGDSTFFHSGIPAVLNAVYHNANILIIILDNHTTSMTGGQPHIGTGKGLRGNKKRVMIKDILKSCGIEHVSIIDAYNLKEIERTVKEGLSLNGISAVIIDGECILRKKSSGQFYIESQLCTLCGDCLSLGCEAIGRLDGTYEISSICNGCGLCSEICGNDAIKKAYINNLCR